MTRARRVLVAGVVGVAATLVTAAAVATTRDATVPAPAHRVPSQADGERHRRPAVVDAGDVEASRRPVPIDAVAPLDTASPPLSVDIPAIGVHSDLETLHLGADGTLGAPRSFDRAGWYADGPPPGRPGPAVIAGHIDSKSGPAVFFRLDRLRPGDRVVVHRRDGTNADFVVTASHRYPKAEFPSTVVYAPTPDPELRLITCAGAFDRSSGHYTDNTVVSATLVGA